MLVSGKCRTYGCGRKGFWQKPVVHNRTIIEFDEQHYCIVRIRTFGWINWYFGWFWDTGVYQAPVQAHWWFIEFWMIFHHRTAIEFDEQHYCIMRIKYFVELIENLMVLGCGRTHGFDPTPLVLIHLIRLNNKKTSLYGLYLNVGMNPRIHPWFTIVRQWNLTNSIIALCG